MWKVRDIERVPVDLRRIVKWALDHSPERIWEELAKKPGARVCALTATDASDDDWVVMLLVEDDEGTVSVLKAILVT